MQFLTPTAQAHYRPVFEALGANLSQIMVALSPLRLLEVGSSSAEDIITRFQNGENRLYIIEFGRDAEGLWKIQSF